ncbi:hypothetical protein Gorai_013263, partial [Gossypium raimondii]|nr:hypothetical protein [Gossypium raimondii]
MKCLKEEIQRFNVENVNQQAASPSNCYTYGTNSEPVDKMNEMQNLQGTILVNVVNGNDGITKNKTSFEAGTCSNNEAAITDILMKLEADDESKVKFSHFTGLHGERIVVGKYSLAPTLLTIVNNIIKLTVDFEMEHLKKISCAYISLMERQKLENVGLRISKLEAKLTAMKVEHSKISERSKVFIDAAEEFNWNPVRF